MKISKNLTKLISIVALALSNTSCSDKGFPYYYEGKIGEDQVTCKRKDYIFAEVFSETTILKVIKPDGRTITYVDNRHNDLKLEYVLVSKKDSEEEYTRYWNDGIGRSVIGLAQAQFNNYLNQIKTIKIDQARENLK